MTGRELVRGIIAGRPIERRGFWLGNPHPDTWPLLHAYFGTKDEEGLRRKLGDDFRWITPQYRDSTYRHPEGKKIFDVHAGKKSHGEAGPLAAAETEADVEAFDWPDPDFLDFGECLGATPSRLASADFISKPTGGSSFGRERKRMDISSATTSGRRSIA